MNRNPKRLTILLSCLCRGGAETQAVRLVKQLADRGWDCRVLSLLSPTDFSAELGAVGIPVESLGLRGPLSFPGAVLRLLRDLKSFPPDVLLTMTIHANVIGKIVGRLAGVSTIVASIRTEVIGSRWRELLETWTEPLAGITVVNSRLVAKSLVERGILKKHRHSVIPNAVVLPDLTGESRSRIEPSDFIEGRRPLWLNVGRLVPAKGQQILLKAFAEVHRLYPGVGLAISGGGELSPSLEDLVTELGLNDSVRMLGERTDVPELMATADFFVLSSLWEGMPNVVLEAMASGLPVVTTEVGGVRELMDGGAFGRLVPPGDERALAEAMISLMAGSEAEWKRMGIVGHDFIRSHHDPAHVADQWENLFHKLLGEIHQCKGQRDDL